MKPTEDLRNEHRAVERMLRILEQMAGRLEAGQRIEPSDLGESIEFLQVFVDRCHHGKEEELLFPTLEQVDAHAREPIRVLLGEHNTGREAVRGLAEGSSAYQRGEPGANLQIVGHARRYSALLAQHIQKEDNVLFPLAERTLSAKQEHELEEGFETIERERIGEGRHEAFHQMLDRLEASYLSRKGHAT